MRGSKGCQLKVIEELSLGSYDSAGRQIKLLRGTAVASPTSTSCLETNQLRERALYELDGAGHRVLEKLQRTTTGSFPNPATTFDRSTAREYSTMCHLDQANALYFAGLPIWLVKVGELAQDRRSPSGGGAWPGFQNGI